MGIGNSNLYTFEEYRDICKMLGIVRVWEFEMGYKIYLKYSSGDIEEMKKGILMGHYNDMYFREGSLN